MKYIISKGSANKTFKNVIVEAENHFRQECKLWVFGKGAEADQRRAGPLPQVRLLSSLRTNSQSKLQSVPSAYVPCYLILTATPESRSYYLSFADKETEAKRVKSSESIIFKKIKTWILRQI